MPSAPPSERDASPQEGSRLPLVCMTCDATYQSDQKNPHETCGAKIKYLTCSVADHHLAAYTPKSGWLPGAPCPQSTYGCTGTLQDLGVTGSCPGRLVPQNPIVFF